MSQSSDCKTVVVDFGPVWWIIILKCDVSGHIGILYLVIDSGRVYLIHFSKQYDQYLYTYIYHVQYKYIGIFYTHSNHWINVVKKQN